MKPLTRAALHTIVKGIFAGGTDLRTVRANLRHASPTSTNHYLHTSGKQLHRKTEEKHRLGWQDSTNSP
ncbi:MULTISPECIES: hypothetical protein [Paraburkholderia]|jgi:hypothetical protein|uniref:hypothetical protein n=1 Tax=Paraburkholderia TaxID=1822464 RepID=UPI00190CDC96